VKFRMFVKNLFKLFGCDKNLFQIFGCDKNSLEL